MEVHCPICAGKGNTDAITRDRKGRLVKNNRCPECNGSGKVSQRRYSELAALYAVEGFEETIPDLTPKQRV